MSGDAVAQVAAQLAAGGGGEVRLPVARLGALASTLRAGQALANRRRLVAGAITLVLALAGLLLFRRGGGDALLAPLEGQVGRDVLSVLSLVVLFGPALVAGIWLRPRWRLAVGWRPFGEVAALFEHLPSEFTGTARAHLATERRFVRLAEGGGRARDTWFELELALPGGGACTVTGSDSMRPGRRARNGTSGNKRRGFTNNLRTTLACTLDFSDDREVNPAAVVAPFALTATQGEGRWSYRVEKDNVLNDGAFRRVLPGDFSALLATALTLTVVRACRCDEIARSDDLPHDHVASGALRQVSVTDADYSTVTVLTCTACGAKLRCTREDSYHHPIITWRKG